MIRQIGRLGGTLLFSALLLLGAQAAWADEAVEDSGTCCSSGTECNPGQACCNLRNTASCSTDKLYYCVTDISNCDTPAAN